MLARIQQKFIFIRNINYKVVLPNPVESCFIMNVCSSVVQLYLVGCILNMYSSKKKLIMHDGTSEALCALQCSFCLTTINGYKESALRYFCLGSCVSGLSLYNSLQQSSKTVHLKFHLYTHVDIDVDPTICFTPSDFNICL